MNSESLINWIEGYLDACKNKPNPNQVKEIRKKIDEYRKPAPITLSGGTYTYSTPVPNLLTDSPTYSVHTHTGHPPLTLAGSTVSDSSKIANDEITELIEKAKRATTMEELDQE